MKKKLVLIGNGMAGVWAVEQLLKLAPNQYEVTVFGSEPHPNYNRILLSSVLAGDAKIDDIVINDWNWYKENGVTLHAGHTVTKIDTERKSVSTASGITAEYDDLIIATGSLPFMLPLPGADKEGVIAFRDINDCNTMIETAKNYKKAIVIGGGLLGLEAARGLLNLNMDVSVVHIFKDLMERQLDQTASQMLRKELEKQGMNFLLEKNTDSILGKKRVTGVKFKDGSVVDADLVVMAVGIKPNVQLAKDSGLEVNRGIVVNDYLETSIPHVYSVGECAEHRGIAYGLVAPLYEQGNELAKRLAGVPSAGYQGSVVSTKLKVSGVDVFSAGQFTDAEDTASVRVQDDFEGVYKKVVIKDGKVIGAVLFGDTSDGSRLFKMIREGEDVTGKEKQILLGEGSGGGAKSGVDYVASMADSEIVCGCNGVSKGTILNAISEKGCTSVNEIKACTKASGSCGGCKPLVADLLALALGADGVQTVKEGICGCTEHSRDEVVEAIRSMRLTSSKEVMNVLEWKTEEGCSKCRPALNYYLGMAWPEEHEEERESRFVNERNHANIQKDGTYSVVPRIYGGVTSPAELKRIAEVAEKFDVPMVKFTGGQRLDLLGVKKEDLPKMWAELDMPSGYAYGKALRTVKTCVGSTFCRFGTQDSIQMGIDLEKRFERLNTPAKVKLAVSGCPRNCAESTIKDFGVIAIDGGWELYVGGNGGVKVRASELLCKVKTEEEVQEWAGAFLQYYREAAKWNERTSEWVSRVGLESIKEALASEEERKALNERIDKTLSLTTDPWKEIIEKDELRATFEELQAPALETVAD
ncbi:nitrite reductase large subunit NirB [Paenibacillus mucilaginosus]|uniref:NasD3 n=3 Tax=Paenibacillus mucilaginosus TaxID=61624 RepID=H6NIJ2_9BACL|nr:nitrite reductase large subunit NirB [Paenibacillus mucilaginosus]AEI42701.1 NasD3 [Paenibacillus mucilaginosus KNP414]AFC32303.1 NasD3 [Paenibacillus mucilaginosus 3016]AFH64609.1 nitrite reductase [Paenibacillus mucilaginosus K02]MCG7217053.1 nitrite reductase large subunit NirB [Paenibacillus mucilaginosus]WDM26085.1 nitrite reductase large subunit NirB [Paenibacillus mucilaginosus]